MRRAPCLIYGQRSRVDSIPIPQRLSITRAYRRERRSARHDEDVAGYDVERSQSCAGSRLPQIRTRFFIPRRDTPGTRHVHPFTVYAQGRAEVR